jgi:hypothetical protein
MSARKIKSKLLCETGKYPFREKANVNPTGEVLGDYNCLVSSSISASRESGHNPIKSTKNRVAVDELDIDSIDLPPSESREKAVEKNTITRELLYDRYVLGLMQLSN